jgi:hypothetical protein
MLFFVLVWRRYNQHGSYKKSECYHPTYKKECLWLILVVSLVGISHFWIYNCKSDPV